MEIIKIELLRGYDDYYCIDFKATKQEEIMLRISGIYSMRGDNLDQYKATLVAKDELEALKIFSERAGGMLGNS